MFSSQSLIGLNTLYSGSNLSISAHRSNNALLRIRFCSLRLQEIPTVPPIHSLGPQLKIDVSPSGQHGRDKPITKGVEERGSPTPTAKAGRQSEGIPGIRVPRQKYISVTKSELLRAILSMFDSQEDIDEFLRLSSYLDSILHAEHKGILEAMRIDYSLMQSKGNSRDCLANSDEYDEKEETMTNGNHPDSAWDNNTFEGGGSMESRGNDTVEPEKPMPVNYSLDMGYLLTSSLKNVKNNSTTKSRVSVATHFQRAFMKLLRDAQFEELSVSDLLLTSALNTDYILTLPIYVDWNKASASNAIIFRRGYATERQKGLLVVEKLDYLQSKLLQRIFFILSKPLGQVGLWINEALKSASQTAQVQVWTEKVKHWFKEPNFYPQCYSYDESALDNQLRVDKLSESDLPIWLAAQRAVPRYEGLLSSIGPRRRLLRKLFMWVGLIPSKPETSVKLDGDSTTSESYQRPIFLSRRSLTDIWKPATKEYCGSNPWKILKAAVSILFSQSVLQEPAFQELILLYNEETDQSKTKDEVGFPSLQLKIYERIPIPDLPVVFPHKKLSFRILDTVRLDIATILGLLAYFVNYKFEDILLSPSAILLDVIAVSALIIYVTRVALGYKQTWDRYQLLVNRTLYEKTLASGFGSVHFLLDASEQQQYKEAILAYALLLQSESHQVHCRRTIGDTCERFVYEKFKEKIEMPVNKAMDTLLRFGLVTEQPFDGYLKLQAVPCSKAYEALEQRWNSLIGLL
ncbi:hypothetical protein NE237_012338 [Protea cynaroides]|uniref:Uncharacterized protein n=1 Tax=Protea cynaroides TaxID=273540 RepID=A0A9Q0GZZ4_9MAGN|nr:hypothetical protein NE237_012338 [Protea cynaroides]